MTEEVRVDLGTPLPGVAGEAFASALRASAKVLSVEEVAALDEDGGADLADLAIPLYRDGDERKVGGEKLADMILAEPLTEKLASATAVGDGNLDYLLGFYGDELRKLPVRVLRPSMFGAVGDGVADDTAALNALFAKVRSLIVSSQYVRVKVDLNGGSYKVTGSGINGTGMQAWNLEICNGTLLGNTTGKAVLDMCGSRGYVMRNVMITGDLTNIPSVGILCARTTSLGFCDNCLFDNVNVIGHFSVAPFFAYAQETTTHLHCRYWQYNYSGKIAIFQRSNTYTVTSEFQTLITGAASFINCSYINVDFRYSGTTNRATVTGISKAGEAVVTAANSFTDGEEVIIFLSLGMTQINAVKAVVKDRTPTQFTMTGVDSTGFSDFTGTAFAYRVMSNGGIYMSGMEDHHFLNCYLVALGDDAIQLDCISGNWRSNTFQFLFEGAQDRSLFRITSGAGSEVFRDCAFKTYNTHARQSFFSTDGGATIEFRGGAIHCSSHTTEATLPLIDSGNASSYKFLAGVDLFFPNRAGVTKTSYGAWLARDFYDDDTDIGDRDYTPSASSTSGTITTLGTRTGGIRFLGSKLALIYGSVTITTNGTGAGTLTVSLPSGITGASVLQNIHGSLASGGAVYGRIGASGTTIVFRKYDGTYPGADGMILTWSGVIEIA